MIFDTQRLKEEADCREIARAIGMTVRGQFCECVSGSHSETQINHCSINREYYHCFSCGDSGDVIAMVQNYYTNILCQPITMQDACVIIGDLLGGHSFYTLDEKEYKKIEKPPLSKEELALLGISENKDDLIRLGSVYLSDKDIYKYVIRELAKKEMDRILELKRRLGTSQYEIAIDFALKDRYKRIQEIYHRVDGKKRRR